MTLAQISSAAVRLVNKENGIKLEKIAEFGTPELGAVVYKDKEWCEYRVMYFADGEHLKKADFHTASILPQDRDEAMLIAERYANPDLKTVRDGTFKSATVADAVKAIENNSMATQTANAIAAVQAHAKEQFKVIQSRNKREGKYARRAGL